eukprot:9257632-Pyramimonas_sp.AAC.1
MNARSRGRESESCAAAAVMAQEERGEVTQQVTLPAMADNSSRQTCSQRPATGSTLRCLPEVGHPTIITTR